jgi:hypothetical protein
MSEYISLGLGSTVYYVCICVLMAQFSGYLVGFIHMLPKVPPHPSNPYGLETEKLDQTNSTTHYNGESHPFCLRAYIGT